MDIILSFLSFLGELLKALFVNESFLTIVVSVVGWYVAKYYNKNAKLKEILTDQELFEILKANAKKYSQVIESRYKNIAGYEKEKKVIDLLLGDETVRDIIKKLIDTPEKLESVVYDAYTDALQEKPAIYSKEVSYNESGMPKLVASVGTCNAQPEEQQPVLPEPAPVEFEQVTTSIEVNGGSPVVQEAEWVEDFMDLKNEGRLIK